MGYTEQQIKSAAKFLKRNKHLLNGDKMWEMSQSRRNYLTKRYTWAQKILTWATKNLKVHSARVAICEECEVDINKGQKCYRLNDIVYLCAPCGSKHNLGKAIKANFAPITYKEDTNGNRSS